MEIIKDKKFKAINVSLRECHLLGWGTSEGVIDCETNDIIEDGKIIYVPVLNDCMSEECFEDFCKRMKWYSEDAYYEDKHFNEVVSKLTSEQFFGSHII